jgi:hypothetical protein
VNSFLHLLQDDTQRPYVNCFGPHTFKYKTLFSMIAISIKINTIRITKTCPIHFKSYSNCIKIFAFLYFLPNNLHIWVTLLLRSYMPRDNSTHKPRRSSSRKVLMHFRPTSSRIFSLAIAFEIIVSYTSTLGVHVGCNYIKQGTD